MAANGRIPEADAEPAGVRGALGPCDRHDPRRPAVAGPISLAIRTGEHWAVLGANGAGKTTLLRLLGAERHPSSGTAIVLGARIGTSDLRQLRSRVVS